MKPVFILGAPRSGTTFLASLLEKTVYGAPFETHFISKYYHLLENYGDLTDYKKFNKLVTDILTERAVMQWDLYLDNKSFFKELGNNISFSSITDQLCLKAAVKKGYKSWGDKTPGYVGEFDIIKSLFPDSKYIYIVRDGRDVALSLLLKDWGPNNIYYCAEYWAELNKDSTQLLELAANGQLYFLTYEDLLDNVKTHIEKIYKFLDMKYSQKDIDELSQTVQKGNYNKWKQKMSTFQIRIFESLAGNSLKKFGYETAYKEQKVSLIYRLGYMCHNLFFRIRHLFIINVIDFFKIKFLGKQPFSE